jgi:hypothetical protein
MGSNVIAEIPIVNKVAACKDFLVLAAASVFLKQLYVDHLFIHQGVSQLSFKNIVDSYPLPIF